MSEWSARWLAALAMPKAKRRTLLRARGWTRVSGYGAETWRPPDPTDRAFYTLAAAAHAVLAADQDKGSEP